MCCLMILTCSLGLSYCRCYHFETSNCSSLRASIAFVRATALREIWMAIALFHLPLAPVKPPLCFERLSALLNASIDSLRSSVARCALSLERLASSSMVLKRRVRRRNASISRLFVISRSIGGMLCTPAPSNSHVAPLSTAKLTNLAPFGRNSGGVAGTAAASVLRELSSSGAATSAAFSDVLLAAPAASAVLFDAPPAGRTGFVVLRRAALPGRDRARVDGGAVGLRLLNDRRPEGCNAHLPLSAFLFSRAAAARSTFARRSSAQCRASTTDVVGSCSTAGACAGPLAPALH